MNDQYYSIIGIRFIPDRLKKTWFMNCRHDIYSCCCLWFVTSLRLFNHDRNINSIGAINRNSKLWCLLFLYVVQKRDIASYMAFMYYFFQCERWILNFSAVCTIFILYTPHLYIYLNIGGANGTRRHFLRRFDDKGYTGNVKSTLLVQL